MVHGSEHVFPSLNASAITTLSQLESRGTSTTQARTSLTPAAKTFTTPAARTSPISNSLAWTGVKVVLLPETQDISRRTFTERISSTEEAAEKEKATQTTRQGWRWTRFCIIHYLCSIREFLSDLGK